MPGVIALQHVLTAVRYIFQVLRVPPWCRRSFLLVPLWCYADCERVLLPIFVPLGFYEARGIILQQRKSCVSCSLLQKKD